MLKCFRVMPLLFVIVLVQSASAQTNSSKITPITDPRSAEIKRYLVFFKNFYPQPTEQQKKQSPNAAKTFLYQQRFNSQNRLLDYLRGLKIQGYPLEYRVPMFLNFLTLRTTTLVVEQLKTFPEVNLIAEDISLNLHQPMLLKNALLNLPLSPVSVCQKANIGIHTHAVLESWMKKTLPVSRVYSIGSETQFSQSANLLDFQNALFAYLSQSLTNSDCSSPQNRITHYVLSDKHALLSDALTLVDSSLDPDLNFSTDDQSHIQILAWSSQPSVLSADITSSVCSVFASVSPVVTMISVSNKWMLNDAFTLPQSCWTVLKPDSPLNSGLARLKLNSQASLESDFQKNKPLMTFTNLVERLTLPRDVKVPSLVLEHLSPRGLSYFGGSIVDAVTAAIKLSTAYSMSDSTSVPDYVTKMQNFSKAQELESIEWR